MKPITAMGGLVIVASLALNGYYYCGNSTELTNKAAAPPGPEVRALKGALLLSEVRALEHFAKSQHETILGISVGTTVARIRVPVVYHYQTDVSQDWKVVLSEKRFVVIAPSVKPVLPVAIDTGKLEAEASGRWSLFTGGPLLEELQRSITKTLDEKARSETYVQLERDAARGVAKDFVAKWLITQEKWKDARAYPIYVFFSDEPIQAMKDLPQPIAASL